GGYLPIAATFTTEKIYRAFLGEYAEKKTFYHGHTYTANPLAVAASIANLEIFKKEKIIEKIQPKIKQLSKGLKRIEQLEHVGQVRQLGMMIGIELVKDKETKQPYPFEQRMGAKVCYEVRKYGVILRPLGDVVVLMPPLSITTSQIEHLLSAVEKAIISITGA
ncbi:MAG: aminotransferase class III-fold pyridoxal phosphate-dependent enzyme, partial [bacterium]